MKTRELVQEALKLAGPKLHSAGQIHQAIVGATEGGCKATREEVQKILHELPGVETRWVPYVRNGHRVIGRAYRLSPPVALMREMNEEHAAGDRWPVREESQVETAAEPSQRKHWTTGFLSEKNISHDSEIFRYIAHRNGKLWDFVFLAYPDAAGDLEDWIEPALEKLRAMKEGESNG